MTAELVLFIASLKLLSPRRLFNFMCASFLPFSETATCAGIKIRYGITGDDFVPSYAHAEIRCQNSVDLQQANLAFSKIRFGQPAINCLAAVKSTWISDGSIIKYSEGLVPKIATPQQNSSLPLLCISIYYSKYICMFMLESEGIYFLLAGEQLKVGPLISQL